MDNFLIYLLKVAAGSALFLIMYLILFRKETFYIRNRIILILSILIPVIIPLLTYTVTVNVNPQPLPVTELSEFSETVSDKVASSAPVPQATTASFSLIKFITWLYFCGVILFVIRGLISLLSTFIIIRNCKVVSDSFPRVLLSEKNHPPFSFYPWAVIPVSEYSGGNCSDILDHESAHLRQGHTFDLLLSEMFIAFQWFNPFAWLLKRYMILNHEYLADHVSVLNRSIKEYQYRLLNIAGANTKVALAHTFNSLIKNRIIMINSKPTRRKAGWKTFAILPAALALSYAFIEPDYVYKTTENEPFSITAAPQIIQKAVKGIVLNEEGKPVQGVRVVNTKVPDEAFGATTGPDGRFSIANVQEGESLMFFVMGYKNVIIKPDFSAEMTVRMEKDPEAAKAQYFANKQGDAQPKQLVVIDGVISDKDFMTASKDLGYDYGMFKMLRGKEATDKYGEKGAAGVYEITTRKKAIEMGQRPPIRRLIPDDFPTFQGKRFNQYGDWVAENAVYPEEARQNKLEGFVSVKFIIQPDGSVTDVQSNSGYVSPVLVNEVIRVVKNSPKWDPPKNPLIDEAFSSDVMIRFKSSDKVLSETPYVVVQEMPIYPGGDTELLYYIAKNTKYPEAAKEAKAEGRVIVRFAVTKEGNADGVSVLKGVHPLLDEEAVRVVSTLKGFEPGKQGGVPVNVWYMVPITFKLPVTEISIAESLKIRSKDGRVPLIVIDGVVSDVDVNIINQETIESVAVLKDQPAVDKYGERARDGVIEIKTKRKENTPETSDNVPFVVVEDMPQFPGGSNAMLQWIADNVRYPEMALKQKAEGRVTVRFVVTAEGKVGEAIILQSDNKIFNDEALRLVNSMPLWKPGSQGGKKVNVYAMVPVEFRYKTDAAIPYSVIRKDGIVSTSVTKTAKEGNEITVRYYEGTKLLLNKYEMYGSSGKVFTIGQKTGYENVFFPFNFKLTKRGNDHNSTSKLGAKTNSRPDISFECDINEPGKWEITIRTSAEKFQILQREEEKVRGM